MYRIISTIETVKPEEMPVNGFEFSGRRFIKTTPTVLKFRFFNEETKKDDKTEFVDPFNLRSFILGLYQTKEEFETGYEPWADKIFSDRKSKIDNLLDSSIKVIFDSITNLTSDLNAETCIKWSFLLPYLPELSRLKRELGVDEDQSSSKKVKYSLINKAIPNEGLQVTFEDGTSMNASQYLATSVTSISRDNSYTWGSWSTITSSCKQLFLEYCEAAGDLIPEDIESLSQVLLEGALNIWYNYNHTFELKSLTISPIIDWCKCNDGEWFILSRFGGSRTKAAKQIAILYLGKEFFFKDDLGNIFKKDKELFYDIMSDANRLIELEELYLKFEAEYSAKSVISEIQNVLRPVSTWIKKSDLEKMNGRRVQIKACGHWLGRSGSVKNGLFKGLFFMDENYNCKIVRLNHKKMLFGASLHVQDFLGFLSEEEKENFLNYVIPEKKFFNHVIVDSSFSSNYHETSNNPEIHFDSDFHEVSKRPSYQVKPFLGNDTMEFNLVDFYLWDQAFNFISGYGNWEKDEWLKFGLKNTDQLTKLFEWSYWVHNTGNYAGMRVRDVRDIQIRQMVRRLQTYNLFGLGCGKYNKREYISEIEKHYGTKLRNRLFSYYSESIRVWKYDTSENIEARKRIPQPDDLLKKIADVLALAEKTEEDENFCMKFREGIKSLPKSQRLLFEVIRRNMWKKDFTISKGFREVGQILYKERIDKSLVEEGFNPEYQKITWWKGNTYYSGYHPALLKNEPSKIANIEKISVYWNDFLKPDSVAAFIYRYMKGKAKKEFEGEFRELIGNNYEYVSSERRVYIPVDKWEVHDFLLQYNALRGKCHCVKRKTPVGDPFIWVRSYGVTSIRNMKLIDQISSYSYENEVFSKIFNSETKILIKSNTLYVG